MTERVVGYILLTIGLLIIAFAGFSTYQVFTKQVQPVQIFNFPAVSIDLGSALTAQLPAEQRALTQSQMGSAAKQEVIPASVLNDSSNLAAHLFLMGFIVSIGYRVGSLGTQLARPVVVKLREAKEEKPS